MYCHVQGDILVTSWRLLTRNQIPAWPQGGRACFSRLASNCSRESKGPGFLAWLSDVAGAPA